MIILVVACVLAAPVSNLMVGEATALPKFIAVVPTLLLSIVQPDPFQSWFIQSIVSGETAVPKVPHLKAEPVEAV
jgi:hypothetical protein